MSKGSEAVSVAEVLSRSRPKETSRRRSPSVMVTGPVASGASPASIVGAAVSCPAAAISSSDSGPPRAVPRVPDRSVRTSTTRMPRGASRAATSSSGERPRAYAVEVARAERPRSTPCGVPKTRSKAAGVLRRALLEQREEPPPSSLTTTTSGRAAARPARSPARCCRAGTSGRPSARTPGRRRARARRRPRSRPCRRCRRRRGWRAPGGWRPTGRPGRGRGPRWTSRRRAARRRARRGRPRGRRPGRTAARRRAPRSTARAGGARRRPPAVGASRRGRGRR